MKKKNIDEYVMDTYHPLDVLKLFNGLEIHNMNKAFTRFEEGITWEAFLVISLRIIDIKMHHAPHVLLGLRNLYNFLV